MYDVLRALGNGPVWASSPNIVMRRSVDEYDPEDDPFIHPLIRPMISHVHDGLFGKDSDELIALGIRSPSFVTHAALPFCEFEKIATNNRIMNVLKDRGADLGRVDTYMELHVMWKGIDHAKWDAFAKGNNNIHTRRRRNKSRVDRERNETKE